MRKWISILCSLCLIAGLSACEGENSTTGSYLIEVQGEALSTAVYVDLMQVAVQMEEALVDTFEGKLIYERNDVVARSACDRVYDAVMKNREVTGTVELVLTWKSLTSSDIIDEVIKVYKF